MPERMFELTAADAAVRGGAYLCQVGACVSCGGCCGLYNIPDLNRARLHGMLLKRTRLFAAVPRTIADIDRFERDRIAAEGADYPVADFHHCVFVGLIQDRGERVGCLLHPLAGGNNGVDWRGLSYYGGAACANFFCPTYDQLEVRQKRLVRYVLDDWYDYGLIVPEHRYLQALFALLETNLGRTLEPDALTPAHAAALADLLRLRLHWPCRTPHRPLGWNFFSTKTTDRPDLPHCGDASPTETALLRELDTDPAQTGTALALLRDALRVACTALSR